MVPYFEDVFILILGEAWKTLGLKISLMAALFLVVSGQIEVDLYLLVISIVSNNILGCPLASPITSYIEKVWALN